MLAMWTQAIVSTWSDDGHLHASDHGEAALPHYRGIEEKRRIVEETLAEGASVALVARAHGVNANLVLTGADYIKRGGLVDAVRPSCCR